MIILKQTLKYSIYELITIKEKKINPETIIYSHEDCLNHSIFNHFESSLRVETILNDLKEEYSHLYFRNCRQIKNEEILLYHSERYLEHFLFLCNKSENERNKVPIDRDTIIMPYTRDAVYYAAGALLTAIDDLMLPINHPNRIRYSNSLTSVFTISKNLF